MNKNFALKGLIVDTPVPGELRSREGYLLCSDGVCAGFCAQLPEGYDVVDCSNHLIIPGMTDLHLHAPQYGFCGTAMDLELLDWQIRRINNKLLFFLAIFRRILFR